jgi:phage terminase Nu1 subunit (DNA packaging protein)
MEKYWRSRLAELEFQSKTGELVAARAVEARVVNLFGLCRTKLLGVPTKARSAMPELTHAQIATLDDLIRQALQDLAATPLVADSGGAAA